MSWGDALIHSGLILLLSMGAAVLIAAWFWFCVERISNERWAFVASMAPLLVALWVIVAFSKVAE